MTEAVAVALHSVNLSGVRTGDTCVVVGAGMIGISVIKLLRISGAARIFVIDINEKRLDNARAAGADHVFQGTGDAPAERIQASTHGRGADISFEAVGKSETVGLSIDVLRKGGKAVLVGNISAEISFPLQKVVTRELQVFGSCAIRGEYETVLGLLESGKISVDDQISVVVPLSQGASWFEKLYSGELNLNKVILKP